MEALWLHIQAPFAAFRGFQAGVYRSTAPVMPPSTAYGLVLNLAGIEMRAEMNGPITLIRPDLPALSLAIGTVRPSEVSTLYQQLHSYPVGASGKELGERTHGAKFWIVPVRRELVVDLDMMLGVRGDAQILSQVVQGLRGQGVGERYGLPFAGDNSFLLDRITVMDTPLASQWYTPMNSDDSPRRGSCRLTVSIDRANNSKTTSKLFAPLATRSTAPPEEAWTWVPKIPSF
jgi:CRISPR-associated protein Cas5t